MQCLARTPRNQNFGIAVIKLYYHPDHGPQDRLVIHHYNSWRARFARLRRNFGIRANRTKDHDLIAILVIAVCALLCAGESFNDRENSGHAKRDWFKTFLTLRNGIPSRDTFSRLFAALDPKQFLDCFLHGTQSLRQAVPQEIIARDGKALRRALNADQSVKYVVTAPGPKATGWYWAS